MNRIEWFFEAARRLKFEKIADITFEHFIKVYAYNSVDDEELKMFFEKHAPVDYAKITEDIKGVLAHQGSCDGFTLENVDKINIDSVEYTDFHIVDVYFSYTIKIFIDKPIEGSTEQLFWSGNIPYTIKLLGVNIVDKNDASACELTIKRGGCMFCSLV